MNIWHDISPKEINNECFTAVIEIPKGSKVKYELGNITELEYKQAELAVKSAENDILSNTSSHDILVFQFEHPYMLSSSSGSSSSSK